MNNTTDGIPPLVNPYDPAKARERGDQMTIVTCPIYTSDVNFFKLIRPTLGTITALMGTLWKKLILECNERNITDVSKQTEFELFVAGCRILSANEYSEYTILKRRATGTAGRGLPNSPISGPMSQTSGPNDGRGIEVARDASPTIPPVIPNVQSGGRTGRGRKRKGQETTSEQNHVE